MQSRGFWSWLQLNGQLCPLHQETLQKGAPGQGGQKPRDSSHSPICSCEHALTFVHSTHLGSKASPKISQAALGGEKEDRAMAAVSTLGIHYYCHHLVAGQSLKSLIH